MPKTPTRKNSLAGNTRRGLIKAHQPFRGDDLEHGKKTGKTVTQVSRDADDFEPFDQVLDQAYKDGTGPRPVTSKTVNGTSHRNASDDDEDEVSGEVSMDIDSVNNSPSVYFNAASAPPPSSAKRVGSSSRPLPRGSSVDYDRIPSPKVAPRRSSLKPRSTSQPLHPSRLRNEVQLDDDEEHSSPRAANKSYTNGNRSQAGAMEDIDFSGNNVSYEHEDDPSLSHNNLSFTALAEEEDEPILDMDNRMSSTPPRDVKGKRKQRVVESDSDMEEEITAGMEAIDQAVSDGEEEVDEPRPPSSHKPTSVQGRNGLDSKQTKKATKPPQPKYVRKQPRISIYDNIGEDGLRRGQRQRYPPLEYWRQEKVVWGRRTNGRSVVPVIKEIITIPKPEPEPLGSKKRKRSGTHPPRSKSRSHASPVPAVEEIRIVEVDNPEAGWDNDTSANGIIIDWVSREEVERRVAYPQRLVKPQPTRDSRYLFHKVFGDGDFVAAGQLVIPPGEEKPPKPTKDNTYKFQIFYIIEGAVECNQYYIKNICQREVKIFFAQARKVASEDLERAKEILSKSPNAPARARTAPQSPSRRMGSTNI
ncbi:hypothetical protein BU17DRAFT_69755 [Hysterangium stoloniferum]|nr:hypothetical protein BU17DRAFT_69755 [Hysterangium stoloniferum]